MQHYYEFHTILMTSWGSLDGFTTEVRISKETAIAFHTLKINRQFPTKEEAESHGLEVAKGWIDTANAAFHQVNILLQSRSINVAQLDCATSPVFYCVRPTPACRKPG